MASSNVKSCFFSNLKMKSINVGKPDLVMLETGKIGHIFPEGINSAIFWISWNKRKNYIFWGILFDLDWELVQEFMF